MPRGPNVEYVRDFHAQPGKKVSVPIRIEPKVYFANERTFLKWLEFNVYLSALAVGLLNFSSPGDRTGLIASSFFTIVALVGIAYSGVIFVIRALKIRKRESSHIYLTRTGPRFCVRLSCRRWWSTLSSGSQRATNIATSAACSTDAPRRRADGAAIFWFRFSRVDRRPQCVYIVVSNVCHCKSLFSHGEFGRENGWHEVRLQNRKENAETGSELCST